MKKILTVVLGMTVFLLVVGFFYWQIKSKNIPKTEPSVAAINPSLAPSCLMNATDLDPVYDQSTCHLPDGRIITSTDALFPSCFYEGTFPGVNINSYFKIASGSSDQCIQNRVVINDQESQAGLNYNEQRFKTCRGYSALQNTKIIRWSDTTAWGGMVPEPGAHVVIPEGKIVLLDVNPPPLASLKIYGALVFDQIDIELTVGSMIMYGVLQVGSPKMPFRKNAVIKLNDQMRKLTPHDRGLLMQGGRMALSGVRDPSDQSPIIFKWGYTTFPNIQLENEKKLPEGMISKVQSAVAIMKPKMTEGLRAQVFWHKKDRSNYGGDFILKNKNGSWRFTDHAHDVNLMYVGYAKCPDVCPMTLGFISQAYKKLSDVEKKRIGVLFLSVDQANDQPESVQKFVDNFSHDFVGLTGSQEEIDTAVDLVGASYNVTQIPTSRLGYSIGHSDRIFLLNRNGSVIRTEAGVRSAETVLKLMKGNYEL